MIKGALTSLFVLASTIATFDVVKANEEYWNPKEVIDEEDWVPENAEGIPIDMIGHMPSEFPSAHAVRAPNVDELNLTFHSAQEFKSAFDFQV